MSVNMGDPLKLSRQHAADIDQSSGRRRSVPIRSIFSRDMAGEAAAPMAQLVRVGGRGGAVLLKLYVALIWRSSAAPFDSALPARKWAELLALPDPANGGARRITEAIKTLEAHRLISAEYRPGEPSRITLLHESGSGAQYSLPRGGAGDHYFQIPAQMWLDGDIQRLSAPGLAMLMAVLTDQSHPGATVWWSTTRFPGRFGLSPATRSRGTKELVDAGLLAVQRKSISTTGRSFAVERVRKIYAVSGSAVLTEVKAVKAPGRGRRAIPATKTKSQPGPVRRRQKAS